MYHCLATEQRNSMLQRQVSHGFKSGIEGHLQFLPIIVWLRHLLFVQELLQRTLLLLRLNYARWSALRFRSRAFLITKRDMLIPAQFSPHMYILQINLLCFVFSHQEVKTGFLFKSQLLWHKVLRTILTARL